jgi:catechol 2,3-dioxygenase-like lactoylglutathione lyase family enzyme
MVTHPHAVPAPGTFPVLAGLHHHAYRCRDGEETRHFYEDVLGLPMVVAVAHDRVPSTGDEHPYVHIFFRLGDGSMLAFFDLFDGRTCVPDPATPPWVNHLALRVDSRAALESAQQRLHQEGVETVGIVDHGWFDSIYFWDPNGIRLELVSATASERTLVDMAAAAHDTLRAARAAHEVVR